MAKARIILYQIDEMNDERNYAIDNFDNFLEEHKSETLSTVTYFRHQLNATLKLPYAQDTLNYFSESFRYTYVSIRNYNQESGDFMDTYPVYYFIMGKAWKSSECIELTLKMDVINTFTESRGNFAFSDRTLVKREMRNRFKHVNGSKYIRYVDDVDEGFSFQLVRQGENPYDGIIENTQGIGDWYIVYRMKNIDIDFNVDPRGYNNLPVFTELLPGNGVEVKMPTPLSVYLKNQDPNGYMYFTAYEVTSGYLSIRYKDKFISTNPDSQLPHVETYDAIKFKGVSDGTITVSGGKRSGQAVTWKSVFTAQPGLLFLGVDSNIGDTVIKFTVQPTNESASWSQLVSAPIQAFTDTRSVNAGLTDSIRQDPYVIKILKYPYAPVSLFRDLSGNTYVNDGWRFIPSEDEADSENMKNRLVNDTIVNLKHEMQCQKFILSENTERIENFGEMRLPRVPGHESKMYNSAYHYNKISFDNASLIFRDEALNTLDATNDTYLKLNEQLRVEMTITSTGGRAILFRFNQYAPKSMSEEDFQNILIVNRNNEEVIYSSAYLDYIEKSYDTDKALNKYNRVKEVILGILSPAQFSTTIGAISSGAKMGASWVDQDIQIWRNMKNAMIQGASLGGCDDIDIFSEVSKNRLLHTVYDLKKRDYEMLNDYFYHYGYLTNVTKVPNHDTRMYFDFLSCALDTSALNNIPEDCRSVLIEKYSDGVTFFHQDANGNYDITQQYENWEKDL